MSLTYRPDWESARDRLTTWWNGGDLGRPAMQISVPRETPWEVIPEVAQPEGWVTDYSTSDMDYHLYVRYAGAASADYLGEAVPIIAPGDEAPGTVSLYLGCQGHEMPGTVWCEPFIEDPAQARFDLDPDNFYWKFTQEASRRALEFGRGKFLCQFPDLIEGLDVLASMRGTEKLLADLIDRPEWVQACLRQITDRYFYYYDLLYDRYRDEVGGSFFWAWAPGRMAKFQCDFSAMIGPRMFEEFMGPVLREMTARVGYCMYHWDGPQAIPHKATLFNCPDLDMLQWTPGAAFPQTYDPMWYPLYHEALDAGKKLMVGFRNKEDLLGYKQEFGEQVKQFMINGQVTNVAEGEEWLKFMEV
jgi:5-methyltetrahydrofolate--homocysteine methyltransferase